jgi:hypothetical protein
MEKLDCSFERAEAGERRIGSPQYLKINQARQGQLVQRWFVGAPQWHAPRQPLLDAANGFRIAAEDRTGKQPGAFYSFGAYKFPPRHARQTGEKEGFELAVSQNNR